MRPTGESVFYDGVALIKAGDAAGAQAAFRESLRLAPHLVSAHINLGLLLVETAHAGEAEVHYRTAIKLDPQRFEAHLHLGAMLAEQKRNGEAEAAYLQALELDPQSPAALSNFGVLLASMKRETEAEACHRTAMAIAPDYRKAAFNLAYLMLRQGRYEEGWAALEARDWYARLEDYFEFPRWHGEPLHRKSLLIGFEAGHGDMIQFCRYASLAKRRGVTRLTIVCHPALKELFTYLDGVDEVLAFDEPVPASGWDFWTPPLSLPFLFQTRADTIPGDLPYLRLDAGPVARADGPLRVGLAWKGNPRFENDADRSLPSLAALAPLGEVPGIAFFSLQKGAGEDEAGQAEAPFTITDLAPAIANFADTAACIMNLDLVIAVDTAVAHLAGALGKPCWVLLPDYQTDWRWLTGRSDTPWYPRVMRLFRQTEAGNWDPVIADVKAALHALCSSPGGV